MGDVYKNEAITAPETDRYGLPIYAGQRIANADFMNWESDDNYVYEFNDGIIDPTTSTRQDENYMLTNLENAFSVLRHSGRVHDYGLK